MTAIHFQKNIELNVIQSQKELHSFLQNMLRTDKEQKWTNKNSYDNLVYFLDKMSSFPSVVYFEKILQRKELENEICQYLNGDLNSLYFTTVKCVNPKLRWTDALFQEMMQIVFLIREKHFRVLMIVIHQDQKDDLCHFHLLLKNL